LGKWRRKKASFQFHGSQERLLFLVSADRFFASLSFRALELLEPLAAEHLSTKEFLGQS